MEPILLDGGTGYFGWRVDEVLGVNLSSKPSEADILFYIEVLVLEKRT